MVEILFVHGALVRDGAWWWRPAADEIARRTGVVSRAVALPSVGEGAGQGTAGQGGADAAAGGLREDAAALQAEFDAVASRGDDAIVVGHSYGGTVIAEGAAHPAARHLVLVSSYLPEAGTTQADIMAGEADPVRVAVGGDGLVRVDGYDEPEFSARFLHDVPDAAVRAAAWSRVTAQGPAAFGTPTTRAAWRDRPTTYLLCADDRSTSVALQREHAARADRAVELTTGHHPFLSRPDLVADELERIVRGL